jgi:hypothetical protein
MEQGIVMPRISIEDRAACAGAKRREPPRHLSAPAKRLWREIIEDRPVDFFRAGSYELLEQYVEMTVEQRAAIKALRQAAQEDYAAKLQVVRRLSSTLATLATKLRLTVQNDINRWAGKTKETGDGPADRLLGGAAVLRAVQY